MTDIVILDAVETLNRAIPVRREIVYINQSTTIAAPFTGRVIVRAMGAAGGGAKGTYATGGNGGTVAIKELRVSQGDSITLTIPAGGAAQTIVGNGNPGGALTVSAPVWTGSIPGGNGGVQGASGQQSAANTAPTGWDAYWLGGRGGASSGANSASGGGGAALRNGYGAYDSGPASAHSGGAGIGGSSTGAGGGGSFGDGVGDSGGPNFSGLTAASGVDGTPVAGMGPDISRLLLDLSGGGGGGGKNGAPGGGGGAGAGTMGNGGFGGGGGGGGGAGSTGGSGGSGGGGGGSISSAPTSGAGGSGFVTLEFLETAL